MKCEKCGGNLSFEVKYCPYCGALNTQAAQHLKDMERFQNEFTSTQEEVYASSKTFSRVSVRIVVLAVLIVCSVILLVMSSRVYSIDRAMRERAAIRNYESCCETIEHYIDNRDYLQISTFCEKNAITYSDDFEKYTYVIRTARAYKDVISYFVMIYQPEMRDETITSISSSLADSLRWFYDVIKLDHYDYYPEEVKNEKYVQAVNQMQMNIEGILKSQLAMTDEEISELAAMSQGKRAYLIEEALQNKLKGGDKDGE